MYRRAKRDKNERRIIQFLERCGATVVQLDDPGIPDLLVGISCGNKRYNFLIEVKSKSGSLTSAQQNFFSTWQGQATVVRSVAEAKRVIRYIQNADVHL